MNEEQVTITGDALNLGDRATSAFTLHFDVAFGRVINAPCGSTTVLSITNFSGSIYDLRVGSDPVNAPSDFTAYLASVTCPQVSQELVSASNTFGLESDGYLFEPNAVLVNGNLPGPWSIEGGRVEIASATEPSTASLLLLGLGLAVLGRRRHRVLGRGEV
jgi:uncharacterized protein (TIGR03382 family)